MIKYFRQYNSNVNCFHVTFINLNTGEYGNFNYSLYNHEGVEYLLTFSESYSNIYDMGYSKPRDYLKRARELKNEQFNIDELNKYPIWNPELLPIEQRERMAASI